MTMHYGILDLKDLRPAISDSTLRAEVDALLDHDAAAFAMSIDPPRLVGAMPLDATLAAVHDFAEATQSAVERCQNLRRIAP